jgi:homoserine O-acetyltransferase
MRILPVLVLAVLAVALPARGAEPYPDPVEGDFVLRDFRFASGEVLPELRIHYRTVGTLARDGDGRASNAVLILHGTGGDGGGFVRPGRGGR